MKILEMVSNLHIGVWMMMKHWLVVLILVNLACRSWADCWLSGTIHSDGDEWPCEGLEDSCNTCYCKNGALSSTQKICKVDASWAEWGDWSACSTSCNEQGVVSKQHRRRKCIDGEYGGTKCEHRWNSHRRDCKDIPDCQVVREALALAVHDEGCKDPPHGIPCCPQFVEGDNYLGTEIFIQEDDMMSSCLETCKTLHPHSVGMTQSKIETYGNGKKKCWCEFGEPTLNPNEKNYQTCVF